MQPRLCIFMLIGAAFAACTARTQSDDDDDGGVSTSQTGQTSQAASSTGTGIMPGTTTVESACAGIAAQWLACYDDPDFDQVSCRGAEACFRLATRDEAEEPLLACYAAQSNNPNCDGPHCIEQMTQFEPTAEHIAHQQRCNAHVAACGGDGGDICSNNALHIEGAVLAALGPCLERGCGAAVEECISQAVSSYLSSCGGDLGGLL
ncbi:MAG TPA: hypothetical protein VFB62_24095 [Polyangiaceae bacterium]|nr:hypothetical protein [Polyangiaceae bacterium]